MVTEQPIIGLAEISKYLPLGYSTLTRRSKILQEKGVLFRCVKGRTATQRRKVVFTYPSIIQRFLIQNPDFLVNWK